MIQVTRLRQSDREAWQPLAIGYNAFYQRVLPAAAYEQAWGRLLEGEEIQGLAARLDGRVVGIAHYLFHAGVWFPKVCYLADLFVDEAVRGQGAARALIEEVAEAARAQGCTRYYWLTQDTNAQARALYDKVARHVGFIRYDYSME
ncbi:MAG: N-acetyltransferase family protein [Reyranella sp.]|uniref:GNAT family N-acetyltransferase n=1 Tax=Reyranella sp. TaxID=1929291 RepID=UPI003D14BD64